MRSQPVTVRIPLELIEDFRARAEVQGYPSLSAYFIGLGQYDLMVCKDHEVTAEMAKQPLAEQDTMNQEISRMYRAGETLKGSWFKHLLEKTMKDVAEDKDLPKSRIVRRFLGKLKGD